MFDANSEAAKKDLEHIARKFNEQVKLDPLLCVHWLMIFQRPDGQFIIYDAKKPHTSYAGIKKVHPDYIYKTIRGCEQASLAASHARASRQALKIIDWTLSQADLANG